MSAHLEVRLPAMAFTLSVKSFQVPATPDTLACPPNFPFEAHFAGHAGDFQSERVELIHHLVHHVFELEDFPFTSTVIFWARVAAGDGGCHAGDIADLGRQAAGHGVHVIGEVLPSAGDPFHLGLAPQLSLGADFLGDAGHFGGKRSTDRPSC